ncbi:MAG TPA: hypothetical protein VMG59_11620 [Phycisphaerae bacterium]|nr:hypothetical protein [Phycisphaerae bacterium]
MGQAPRDPDQLARDILAGRVSIQELAREQARRRAAAQGGPAAPAAPVRPTPPPPRVIPQQQIPVARPVQVAGPVRQRVVRLPPPPNKATRPTPPIAQASPVAKTSPAVKDPYAIGSLVSMQLSPAAKAAMPPQSGSRVPPPSVPRSRTQVMRKILTSHQGLRTLFLVSEILNKPLALRPDALERL